MIKVIEGDLLLATENIIGHQVNCMGVMGAGLARQIKSSYKEVYEKYKTTCDSHEPDDLLGKVQLFQIGVDKYVANLFGQKSYGRKGQFTNYVALEDALVKLRRYAEKNELTVALPYGIGAGLAGGDWDIIQDNINNAFQDYEVTLYRLKQSF